VRDSARPLSLLSRAPTEYGDPERIAAELAKHKEVESVNIVAGDWELIMKSRTKDQDEYFSFLKNVISREKGIEKTRSIISLKEVKTEFIKT